MAIEDNGLYVHGPNDSWSGVCEVIDAGSRYIYYSQWPHRSNSISTFNPPDVIIRLVNMGNWRRMLDPALTLTEGL